MPADYAGQHRRRLKLYAAVGGCADRSVVNNWSLPKPRVSGLTVLSKYSLGGFNVACYVLATVIGSYPLSIARNHTQSKRRKQVKPVGDLVLRV